MKKRPKPITRYPMSEQREAWRAGYATAEQRADRAKLLLAVSATVAAGILVSEPDVRKNEAATVRRSVRIARQLIISCKA